MLVTCSVEVNRAIRAKLTELGGREERGEDEWRASERYGLSVGSRRFVFRDPAHYSQFEEFVRTKLPQLCDRFPRRIARKKRRAEHGA